MKRTTVDEPENALTIQDFRGPLAAIRAGTELLTRSGLSQPQVQRIARNVYGASVQMLDLLEEFQDQGSGRNRLS
jgi:hypothetical protein